MDDGGLRVSINGFDMFGSSEGCQWLATQADGCWNGAGTSHAHSTRIRTDGWFSNLSHRQGRAITIAGSVWASDQRSLDASRQRLMACIPLTSGTLTVTLDGQLRQWNVRQDAGEIVITRRSAHIWDFSIPLVSLSPYSFGSETYTASTLLPSTSGGLGHPTVFAPDGGAPLGAWTWTFSEHAQSGAVNLDNPGAAPSPVGMRIDGPVRDPQVEHVQTGGILAFTTALGAGHWISLDSSTRQALIDGSDPARGQMVRRGWSEAQPGANTWNFSAAQYDPKATLTVSFRGAYL